LGKVTPNQMTGTSTIQRFCVTGLRTLSGG
jgi:hypothetical protein